MENRDKIFDHLFCQYKDWVFRLCYSYTRSEAEANDLLQECFLKVWVNLPHFQHRSDYSTWIYRIVANTCLMQLRKDKNNPVEYHEQYLDKTAEEHSDENEIRSESLFKAIGQLAQMDRLVISMVLEGISHKQIGEVLGITENNVNIKVFRIKKQLKDILSEK